MQSRASKIWTFTYIVELAVASSLLCQFLRSQGIELEHMSATPRGNAVKGRIEKLVKLLQNRFTRKHVKTLPSKFLGTRPAPESSLQHVMAADAPGRPNELHEVPWSFEELLCRPHKLKIKK